MLAYAMPRLASAANNAAWHVSNLQPGTEAMPVSVIDCCCSRAWIPDGTKHFALGQGCRPSHLLREASNGLFAEPGFGRDACVDDDANNSGHFIRKPPEVLLGAGVQTNPMAQRLRGQRENAPRRRSRQFAAPENLRTRLTVPNTQSTALSFPLPRPVTFRIPPQGSIHNDWRDCHRKRLPREPHSPLPG